MRPPFAYYGGKTGLAGEIVAHMPPHRVYVEPFFGAGSVFFAKKPATHEIINDLDNAVVTFFRCLRDRLPELEAVCALSPHARTEFRGADLDAQDLDDLETARRFWVRVNQSFAKSSGKHTGFSVTTSRSQGVPATMAGRLGRFAECADRLMATTIEHLDAVALIERVDVPDAVFYVDPPYVAGSRRSGGRSAPVDYRVEMCDAENHERLAEVLHGCAGAVLLSGYHSPLYDDLYDDWDRVEWAVNVHASNSVTATRGTRTEVLWSNRPLATPTQGSFALALAGSQDRETPE